MSRLYGRRINLKLFEGRNCYRCILADILAVARNILGTAKCRRGCSTRPRRWHEKPETIRRSRAMDQMRIERRVTTGFRGLGVPARTGRVLFRIGGKRAVGFRDFVPRNRVRPGKGEGLIGDEIWGAGRRKAQGIFDYHREGAIKSVDAIVADSKGKERERESERDKLTFRELSGRNLSEGM